ncbi:MAG: hypothetical protein FP816_15335 [Desulfobacteraceae bacterium]|nr:hypothetical protein [Desulfobacteraceae bacterium]MBU4001686.1 hypothetical protein [Pseudomonadota bacterium]
MRFFRTGMMKKNMGMVFILALVLAQSFLFVSGCASLGTRQARPKSPLPKEKVPRGIEELVKIKVTPEFNFGFDRMRPGVLQHLDRQYTYDVVPPELMNGLLFQGIHRPPKGTAIEIELLAPAKIYFFFHHREDGGYTDIFSKLKGWKRSAMFPQYDIHHGDHGLNMVMYQLEADAGIYAIAPTTKDRACFSIVFQPKNR